MNSLTRTFKTHTAQPYRQRGSQVVDIIHQVSSEKRAVGVESDIIRYDYVETGNGGNGTLSR